MSDEEEKGKEEPATNNHGANNEGEKSAKSLINKSRVEWLKSIESDRKLFYQAFKDMTQAPMEKRKEKIKSSYKVATKL